MASNKRKQDEKHLKILRELAALQHNKQCFDCHQRGPTYVNITIGAFVCTSCSGILRGLNPPHRVKSISMTSFTSEEIDLLKSKGNEYCRHIWMGSFDSRTQVQPDFKDDSKIKDFMINKYEKKRWYVDPSQAGVNSLRQEIPSDKPTTSSSSSLSSSTNRIVVPGPGPTPASQVAPPQTRPLKQLLGEQTPNLIVQNASAPSNTSTTTSQPASKPTSNIDLLSDLGVDPFGPPPQPPSSTTNNAFGGGSGFANFAPNQPSFPTSDFGSFPPSGQDGNATSSATNQLTSNKYSGLDGLFSVPSEVTAQPSAQPAPTPTAPAGWGSTAPPPQAPVVTNPFAAAPGFPSSGGGAIPTMNSNPFQVAPAIPAATNASSNIFLNQGGGDMGGGITNGFTSSGGGGGWPPASTTTPSWPQQPSAPSQQQHFPGGGMFGGNQQAAGLGSFPNANMKMQPAANTFPHSAFGVVSPPSANAHQWGAATAAANPFASAKSSNPFL